MLLNGFLFFSSINLTSRPKAPTLYPGNAKYSEVNVVAMLYLYRARRKARKVTSATAVKFVWKERKVSVENVENKVHPDQTDWTVCRESSEKSDFLDFLWVFHARRWLDCLCLVMLHRYITVTLTLTLTLSCVLWVWLCRAGWCKLKQVLVCETVNVMLFRVGPVHVDREDFPDQPALAPKVSLEFPDRRENPRSYVKKMADLLT